MANTLVTVFREPIRAIMGDFHATLRRYQDTNIDQVVRTAIQCGRAPGYALATGNTEIAPAVATPVDFGLITYQSCLIFLGPNVASYSYGTRALRESFGNQRDFLMELQDALRNLEGGGTMFTTWQSFYGWVNSITGLEPWGMLTDMDVNAPVGSASFGSGGFTVSSG